MIKDSAQREAFEKYSNDYRELTADGVPVPTAWEAWQAAQQQDRELLAELIKLANIGYVSLLNQNKLDYAYEARDLIQKANQRLKEV